MNEAVYMFKRYEDRSLSYSGLNRHVGQAVGGWSTVKPAEGGKPVEAAASAEAEKPVEVEKPVEAEKPVKNEKPVEIQTKISEGRTSKKTPSKDAQLKKQGFFMATISSVLKFFMQ